MQCLFYYRVCNLTSSKFPIKKNIQVNVFMELDDCPIMCESFEVTPEVSTAELIARVRDTVNIIKKKYNDKAAAYKTSVENAMLDAYSLFMNDVKKDLGERNG